MGKKKKQKDKPLKCSFCNRECKTLNYHMFFGLGHCEDPKCIKKASKKVEEIENSIYGDVTKDEFPAQAINEAGDFKRFFMRVAQWTLLNASAKDIAIAKDNNPHLLYPPMLAQYFEERVIHLIPEQYIGVITKRNLVSSGSFEIKQSIPIDVMMAVLRKAGILEGEGDD